MIASIGPFWDANETWLVLAIGLLLIAFPEAHSLVLYKLYIPAVLMLCGLILRGVSFDFRAKAVVEHKHRWDILFKLGSILTSLMQGYMLGQYVLGFDTSLPGILFCIVSALCVTAAYSFIGGAWLIMKTAGPLQQRAFVWTRCASWLCAFGILLVSVVNPLVSDNVFARWFTFPDIILLAPIPLLCVGLFIVVDRYVSHGPHQNDFGMWIPFTCAVAIFFLVFQGLGYSFYPYIVPGELTVWQAASATESLQFIFYGTVVVFPAIILYTLFSYWVFRGKTKDLRYY